MSEAILKTLGTKDIPLIGIPPDATLEICDDCSKLSYFLEIHLTSAERKQVWLCKSCKEKRIEARKIYGDDC